MTAGSRAVVEAACPSLLPNIVPDTQATPPRPGDAAVRARVARLSTIDTGCHGVVNVEGRTATPDHGDGALEGAAAVRPGGHCRRHPRGRPATVRVAGGLLGRGPCHGAPTRGTPADECLVVRYTVVPVDAPRGRLRVVRRVARVPPRPASTGGPCFTFKRPVLPDVEAATAGRSAFVALAAAVCASGAAARPPRSDQADFAAVNHKQKKSMQIPSENITFKKPMTGWKLNVLASISLSFRTGCSQSVVMHTYT